MGAEHYVSLFTKSVFIDNMILAYFLGMAALFWRFQKKLIHQLG